VKGKRVMIKEHEIVRIRRADSRAISFIPDHKLLSEPLGIRDGKEGWDRDNGRSSRKRGGNGCATGVQ